MNEEKALDMKYEYWLASVIGLTRLTRRFLLESEVRAEEVYHMSEQALKENTDMAQEDIKKIIEAKSNWNLDERYMKFMETGINFTTMRLTNYPAELKELVDPPYGLFYVGRLPTVGKKRVAIVGARGRTAYGNEVAKRLAYLLAKQNIDVISGLAIGIDTDAHSGCLEGGGITYGVLGCGVDICYPRQNQYLYEKIIQSGGVLSENPIGTQPMSFLFPPRNRIISGLSNCVVVVEAKKKSGSLITADFAMEQGKDVYAVPGRISEPLSGGCNQLIFQGAGILNDLEAFVKDLAQINQPEPLQLDFHKNLLEKEEWLVYSLLDFCPKGLGTLVECSGLPLTKLLIILNGLTQKGYARETVPNYFTRTL